MNWTPREVNRLRELRAAGFSEGRCAVELGRTRGSVSGQVRRIGIAGKPSPRFRGPGELLAAVKRLRRFRVCEIADLLGVSRAAVYGALARLRPKAESGSTTGCG